MANELLASRKRYDGPELPCELVAPDGSRSMNVTEVPLAVSLLRQGWTPKAAPKKKAAKKKATKKKAAAKK